MVSQTRYWLERPQQDPQQKEVAGGAPWLRLQSVLLESVQLARGRRSQESIKPRTPFFPGYPDVEKL